MTYTKHHSLQIKKKLVNIAIYLGVWRIESRSLHRPRIEETDQVGVLGEFLFGGHESNTKKRTLLKMWKKRQRLIRNNQENAET